MSHTVSRFFTKDDLTRIQNAVQEAESHSAGEIVPYVVDHSDAYEEAEWRCAVMLSAFALALLAFLHSQTSVWLPFDVAEMAIAVPGETIVVSEGGAALHTSPKGAY